MGKRSISKIALYICYLLVLYVGVIFYPKWKNSGTEATISWDVSGYYMYLPAIFIYHDIKHCAFKDKILKTYQPTPDFQQAFVHPSGNYVMKYSIGQAIMLSPFFFVAHAFTKITGSYPADGFSFPYQLCIGLGALFYCLLGLWFLRKILSLYFSDIAVAVTLLIIVLASNYLNYAAIDGAMTHNTLFTLYGLLILTTISFYNNPSLRKALLIGAICGLAIITRPSEAISIIIPLFFGIATLTDLKQRSVFFKTNIRYPALIFIGLFALVFLQLAYWKYVSGQWVVYSYQNSGFDWLDPHFYDATVGYKSGWLVYSPAMVFSIIGFIFLFIYRRKFFFTAFIFTLLFMYINFAWQEWWYGGGLGQRCMVQCYMVLAFPLAAFSESVYKKRNVFAFLLTPVLLLCGYYNLWLTYQAHKGGLYKPAEMTKAYFWRTVGRFDVDERMVELLDNKDLFAGHPMDSTIIYTNNFNSDTTVNSHTDNTIEGKSIFIDKDHQFSGLYSFPLPKHLPRWVRISADCRLTQKEWDTWKMPQMIIKVYQKEWLVKAASIRINRLISNDGQTKNISMDIRLPEETMLDHGVVYFWDAESDKKVVFDNLKVVAFDY